MSERADVIYEVNMFTGKLTVIQPGVWGEVLRSGHATDNDDQFRRFAVSYIDRDDREEFIRSMSVKSIAAAAREDKPLVSVDFRALVPQTGEFEWFNASTITPRGEKCYGSIRNIQRDKEHEQALRYRAEHDPLTALYNRAAFEQRMAKLLSEDGARGLFCIADIDDFKLINDSRGHLHGDKVLSDLARILGAALPAESIIGRFGGDEFVFCCPGADDIDALYASIREACRPYGELDGFTMSVGAAAYPADGGSMSELLSKSDRALYHVKTHGKRSAATFEPSMPAVIRSGGRRRRASGRRERRRSDRGSIAEVISILAAAVALITGAGIFLRSYFGQIVEHIGTGSAEGYETVSVATFIACFAVVTALSLLFMAILLIRARSRTELKRLAYDDPVTSGANHARFVRDAKELLAGSDCPYTVVCITIDRFKLLNERFGRDVTDALLGFVSDALEESCKQNETSGRLFAENFAALIATDDPAIIAARAAAWLKRAGEFGAATERFFAVTLSFGAYVIDDSSLDIDVMTDRASMPLREQRSQESGRVMYYDEELRERMRIEQDLCDRMETAIESGELEMYLQPQYSVADDTISGFEALVRWDMPGRQLLYPGQFIYLFERNGFILKLDLYMFEKACSIIKKAIDEGREPLPISVNVSRAHVVNDSFLREYLSVWERYGVPQKYLLFEFTETAVCEDLGDLKRVIDDLHSLGFVCCIDDFGAGSSSLNMISSMSVDVIKLDRSFLGGTANGEPREISERRRSVIGGVIDIAHSLGIKTVAEGVEHAQQAEFLRSCGCDGIQGFYYSKPMPVAEALRLFN